MDRYRCIECQHVFIEPLKAPHPFAEDEMLEFCPACKNVDSGRLMCQIAGCHLVAVCGSSTPEGIRHVCWRHFRRFQPL